MGSKRSLVKEETALNHINKCSCLLRCLEGNSPRVTLLRNLEWSLNMWNRHTAAFMFEMAHVLLSLWSSLAQMGIV